MYLKGRSIFRGAPRHALLSLLLATLLNLLAFSNPAHAAFQTSGLIANWQGSSLSGASNTWVDSVNSNSMTLYNTTYSSTNGGYLNFNGTNAYAYKASALTSFTASTVSMFFWINANDLSATRVIQEISRSGSNINGEQQFELNATSGTLSYWDWDAGNYGLNGTSTGSIIANKWNYVGFVKKPTGGGNSSLTFYINGQAAGTITSTNSVTIGLTDFDLGLDYRDTGIGPKWFYGKIGQATIWSSELSASDVLNNYNATNGNFYVPNTTISSNSQSIYLTQSFSTVTETNTGGTATYSISPALPAGLVLDVNSGAISGTPTVASPTTTYTITATNLAGSITQPFTLSVTQAGVVLTGPASVIFRQSATLQATPNGTTVLAFYANGKRIPSCQRVGPTSSSVSCTWKPSLHGANKVYVRFNISGISGQSNTISVLANSRTNNR